MKHTVWIKHTAKTPNQHYEQLAYANGWREPRYPVPAIILEAWLDVIMHNQIQPAIVVRDNGDVSYTEVWPNDYRATNNQIGGHMHYNQHEVDYWVYRQYRWY